MNENVDGMMMDARAAVISVQDGHVAAEDVQWNA